jgi:hypothetical protein
MGLFDNVFGDKAAARDLTKQEAFAGILMAAGACDGHVSDEEALGLYTAVGRMRMYQNVSENKWNALVDHLLRHLKKEGPLGLVDRCAEFLPEGLRECAFANACDLVLADGTVEDEEKEFLDHLQKALELDGDTALTIVEVMITKNKG